MSKALSKDELRRITSQLDQFFGGTGHLGAPGILTRLISEIEADDLQRHLENIDRRHGLNNFGSAHDDLTWKGSCGFFDNGAGRCKRVGRLKAGEKCPDCGSIS